MEILSKILPKNMIDVKVAISYGIFFGIGLVVGWYLTCTGVFSYIASL